jgi:membrane protease YdiL (CAAX protease family)
MNLRPRALRLLSALALFLTLPGLAPYRAAAQVLEIPAAGVEAVPGAAAAAAGALAAPVRSLTPLPLSATPSASAFAPSAEAAAPTAPAPAAAASAAPAVRAAPARTAAADAPASRPAAARPAAAPGSVRAAAPAAPAERGLPAAATRLSAARGESLSAASLDALYEGAASRAPLGEAVPAAAESPSPAPSLRPAAAPAAGPRWVFRSQAPASPAAPRTGLKRTLSVGYLTGFLGLILTQAAAILAGVLGWVPHGNYHVPFQMAHLSPLGAVLILIGGSVMAPVAEEVLFRGGLQGGLSKLTSKLRLGKFWIPALITASLFVVVHETADPVLMAVRFGFAFALSRTFYKEGILASMTAHGTFNGLTFLPLILAAFHVPLLGQLAALPLAAYGAWRAWRTLRAQKPEIASGALAPKPFTARLALLFIPLLLGGFFFVMPNFIWIYGAGALTLWLGVKGVAALRRLVRAKRA